MGLRQNEIILLQPLCSFMSNVILRPGKNADEKVFQISSADGVMLDSIKIVGEDNAEKRIYFDNCKDAKVCNKF